VPQVYGLSDVGSVRQNNEDSFLIDPVLGLYLVADGMGGAQAGEVASHLAVETAAEVIAAELRNDDHALHRAFHHANRRIRERSRSNPALEGMGTTLVAALEDGYSLWLASVGDSRIYVLQDGVLTSVFEDQTWVNEIGKVIGLDAEALRNHPMRHVLTMAIGVTDDLRVQTCRLQPHPGWQLLLCSDGLHGIVPAPDMEKILSGRITLDAKCHSLIEAAKQAGGPDNITVLLLAW
jgi:protein phosphatase